MNAVNNTDITLIPTYPMAAMLQAGQVLTQGFGENMEWQRGDEADPVFFELIRAVWGRQDVNVIANANLSADAVNTFLEEKGFPPMLSDAGRGLYMAAVEDLVSLWMEEGSSERLFVPALDLEVPGFTLEGDQVETYADHDGDDPFVTIKTQSGRLMVIKKVSRLIGGAALLCEAYRLIELIQTESRPDGGFRGVHLPDVDAELRVDLMPAIGGMNLGAATVLQAKAIGKFRMNRKGARTEVAAAAGAFESVSLQYQVDGPFIRFEVNPSANQMHPISPMYIGTEHFKSPPEGFLEG